MKKDAIPNYESILKNIEDSVYEELRRVQQNKSTYSDLFIKLHITEGLQKEMKSKIEEVYTVYKKISDKIQQFQNYEKQSAVNADSDEEAEIYIEKKREIASEYVQLLANFVLSEVSGRRKPAAGGVVAVLEKDTVSQEKIKQLERKYISRNTFASISETIEIDLSTKHVLSKEPDDNDLEEDARELDPKKSSRMVDFDLKEPTQEVMSDLKESSKKEHTDIPVFTQGDKSSPAEVHSDPETTTALINTPLNAEKITSEGISTTKENKEQLAFEESAFTIREDENKFDDRLQTKEKDANEAGSLGGTQNSSEAHSTSLNKQNDFDETIRHQQGLIEHEEYPFLREEQFSSSSKLLRKSQIIFNSQERIPIILKKSSFVDKEENLEAQPNHLDPSKEYLKADSQDILQATPKNGLLPAENEGSKDIKILLTQDNDSLLNKSKPSQALLDFLSTDFASQTQKTESTNMKENYGFSAQENDWYNHRTQSDPFTTVPKLETRVQGDFYGVSPIIFSNTNEETYSPLLPAKVQISLRQNPLRKISDDDDHANPFRIEDHPLHLILKQRIPTEEEEVHSLHHYNSGSVGPQTQLSQNDTEYRLLNQNDSFRLVRKSSSQEMLKSASSRPDSASNWKNGKTQNSKPYSPVSSSYIEYLKALPKSPGEKGTNIQEKLLPQKFKSFVGNSFAKDKSLPLYSHIIEGNLPNRIALKNSPLTNQLTTMDDIDTQQDQLPAKSKMTWVAKQIFNTPNQTQHSNLKSQALNRWPKNSDGSPAQSKGLIFSSTRQQQSAVSKEDLDKPIDFRKLLGIK